MIIRKGHTRDSARLGAAVLTMVEHQADPPPSIIHMLRVLLDREAYPPGHAQWVESGVRAILKNWEHSEDPARLKSDLGLAGPKRRKERTMRRETTLAAAVANAALAGVGDPRKAACIKLNATAHDVRVAWKKWAPVYIGRMTDMKLKASAKERPKIRRAIAMLDQISKDKN